MFASVFRVETRAGETIRLKNTQVRFLSQVLSVRLPLANLGLIWNRPLAVVVQESDNDEQVFLIPDPTRIAVITLGGLCFTSALLMLFIRRKRISSSKEFNR